MLDIPLGAGTFSDTTLEIIDGQTQPFQFTPGKKAGDHILTLDIP